MLRTATAILSALALTASLTACSTSAARPTPTGPVGNLAKCPGKFSRDFWSAYAKPAKGISGTHPLPHTVTAALICNYALTPSRDLVSEGLVSKPRVFANTLNRNESHILSVFESNCHAVPGPRKIIIYFTLENRSIVELNFYCDGRAWSSYNQQRYGFSQKAVSLIDTLAANIGVQE